jgi:hypothetical protein
MVFAPFATLRATQTATSWFPAGQPQSLRYVFPAVSEIVCVVGLLLAEKTTRQFPPVVVMEIAPLLSDAVPTAWTNAGFAI